MLRILLFVGTNIAILAMISIVFSLLGFSGLLEQNGVDLDLAALLVYALVIGFAGSIISILVSKPMAKASMGVSIIDRPRNDAERFVLETVRSQAKRAGIGMPEVGIFDHAAPNAFATGWNKNAALVAVSTGLLNHMEADEVAAVLGHEVAHVANGDMVTLALIQGVVNTFVIFFSRIVGHFVDRVVFRVEQGHGPAFWIVSMIAEMLFGIIAMMIVMWFSRQREFRADIGGAELAGRDSMIRALQALKRTVDGPQMPDEMQAMAISGGRLHALFASHPPLDVRIEALAHAGGATPVPSSSRQSGPWG